MTHPIFRYRTPLCVLCPPKIIATACYILAQRIVDGPHSLSLDARVSPSAPSASLPTPPTHKATSPDASRFAIEFFGLKGDELLSVAGEYVLRMPSSFMKCIHVADALAILLNFYEYQAALGLANYLDPIMDVSPQPPFFFVAWGCSSAHQGPATNGDIVSDATLPVLRGSRRIWYRPYSIAIICRTQ